MHVTILEKNDFVKKSVALKLVLLVHVSTYYVKAIK